jgi:hypothetical protein
MVLPIKLENWISLTNKVVANPLFTLLLAALGLRILSDVI